MQKTDKEKIPISRILSNVFFVLQYAFRIDAALICSIFAVYMIGGAGYALLDTLFIKTFIDFLMNVNRSFSETALLIVFSTMGMAVLMATERCTKSLTQPRITKVVGKIQEDMIQKAVKMDLMNYDCDTYYDDFVVTASQLEIIALDAIFSVANMGRCVTTILLLSGFISTINPIIALFPVIGFLINMVTRFRITKLEYAYSVEEKKIMRRAEYSKRVFYQPEYSKEIKLSHIEVPLERQFHQAIDDTLDIGRKYGKKIAFWSLMNWILVFTFLSYYCVPMYLGYLALVKCSILLGDVAGLNNAQRIMRNRFDGINYCMEYMQKVGLFAEKFRRFMDYESQIEGKTGICETPSKKSSLEIKDMSFRYDGAKKDTLKHINMTIQPGEKIALVGENGAGKSTFVKLLMRLYDVSEGSICYGGNDIREYTTKEYRDLFGSVFQDYQIYAASVEENVMMHTVQKDEEETVQAALQKAGFAKRLESLPNGLATSLTREFAKDGVQLSGGEAQKVAIARLFAKQEKIHIAILDEPSSALDPKAEFELNQNMLLHAGDATVIFISHRLSTTRNVDRIYMFEHGHIIEEGTHEELMALDGEYAKMFRCQSQYYQENLAITL